MNQVHTQPASIRGERIPPLAYLLTGCVAIVGCNSLGLGPIAPEVAQSLGSSVAAVMMAAAAFGLGTAASALFLARYIDRYGAWRLQRLSMAVLCLALLSCAAAFSLPVLIGAQCLAGIASGVALPAIYSSAAAIAPVGRESRTIGAVLTGWTISMVAGVSLSAVLADLVHWRAVYAVIALLAASVALALAGMRKAATIRGVSESPLVALRIPGVARLLLACGAFMTAFYGVYGYLGDHLHSGLGQPISANGLAALAYGTGFGAAAFLDGMIDRIGPRRLLPLAFLVVAAVYTAIAAASTGFTALLAAILGWGLVNHLALNTLIMQLTSVDPARRGAIMGLNSAVTYFAVFAGTSGFAPLYETAGFAASALAAAALLLATAAATQSPTP